MGLTVDAEKGLQSINELLDGVNSMLNMTDEQPSATEVTDVTEEK